jgi:metal-responsive CopG/Arc/MetJ family transcriptional regulator
MTGTKGANSAKVAISMPARTLGALDRAARRLRLSRSAAIAQAVDDWLRAHDVSDEDRRYVQGYLDKPERRAASTRLIAAESWDEWK